MDAMSDDLAPATNPAYRSRAGTASTIRTYRQAVQGSWLHR